MSKKKVRTCETCGIDVFNPKSVIESQKNDFKETKVNCIKGHENKIIQFIF